MGENECRDCIQVKNLWGALKEVKESVKSIDGRLSDIEKDNAVNDEKFITLSGKIDELKDSINSIVGKIDIIAMQPAKRWDDVVKIVLTVVITAVLTYFLKK